MGQRRLAREFALSMLYLIDIGTLPLEKVISSFWHSQDVLQSTKEFANFLTQGTYHNLEKIDQLISKHAENWELNRMASIDLAILRIATFELINQQDTPVNVIINEAIEIAKYYSTTDSGKFVNGILDKIKEEVRKNTDSHR